MPRGAKWTPIRRAKTEASWATNARVRIEKQYQAALMKEATAKAALQRLLDAEAAESAADSSAAS